MQFALNNHTPGRVIHHLKQNKAMNLSLASQVRLTFFKLPEKRKITLKRSLIRKIMQTGFVSAILFITTSLQLLFGSPLKSQTIDDVNIRIGLNNVTLVQAFQKIEAHTSFRFMYRKDEVQNIRNLDVKPGDRTVGQLLRTILSGTSLTYRQVNNQVLIMPSEGSRSLYSTNLISSPSMPEYIPKANIVKGRVTNAQGEPLAGVSVTIKGTQTGTLTDENGNYSLDVPPTGTLVFSFVGFTAQEVSVNGRSNIDITLVGSVSELEQVVVVGYGTQKKVNLTGSVSNVRMDAEMDNRPITNSSQALSGKAPGVWVSQNSGKPGADGAQIRIRGWGTMNNSDPLVVIDGVEGRFDQVNPVDIESISVLKDAASAAIYGSKAANGVILITTKRGKRNEETEINVISSVGVQSIGRTYDFIDNSVDYMNLFNEGLVNIGSSPLYPDYLIDEFRKGTDPYKYPNTNWNKALFRKGLISNSNISLSGGSEKSTMYLSFNYLTQNGIVPNTNTRRFIVRSNLSSQVKSWLRIGTNINYSRSNSREPYLDQTYGSLGRVFTMLDGAPPFIAPYTRDGRFGSVQAIDKNGVLLYDNRNPLIDDNNGLTATDVDQILASATAEVKLTKNLRINTALSTNTQRTLMDAHNQSLFGYTDDGQKTITKNYNREGIEMWRNDVSSIDNTFFTTLNYDKRFADNNFSFIAGTQLENLSIKNVRARRTNPPIEGLTQVDAGTSGLSNNGNLSALRMFSYFGRLNYSFKSKFLFEADFRADASSRFKEGERWGYFPGFSAGWQLGDENFIKNLGIFSSLKLRASWGRLGNQQLSSYWPYLSVINQSFGTSYSSGGALLPGGAVTNLVDNDITWEKTNNTGLGIDAGFLSNRLNVSLDYFKKKTYDILVQLPVPLDMGEVTPAFENIGEMKNNGVELNLNYRNAGGGGRDHFGYEGNLNFTYIDNRVTKFQGGKSPDQLFLIREGFSYNTIYGYKMIGIFQSADEVARYLPNNDIVPTAGDIKLEDVNGDGKIDFQDKQNLGNTIPKITFGLESSLAFRGFNLNFLFQGVAKVYAFTQNEVTTVNSDIASLTKRWERGWTPDHKNTDIPMVKVDYQWNNLQSSFWVNDVSFLKLRNVQLSYNLPNELISRLKLKMCQVYINAENLFTLVSSDYEGYDPERNNFNTGTPDINHTFYPNPRTISLGVNLKF